MLRKFGLLTFILILCLSFLGCKKGTGSRPASFTASEEAIATLAGNVNVGVSTGALARQEIKKPKTFFEMMESFASPIDKAYAATVCPTLLTGGADCSTLGAVATLTYNSCSFLGSTATWSGSQILTIGGPVPACGSFPTFAATNTVTRVFSSGTARSYGSLPVVITLDTTGSSTGWSTPITATGVSTTFAGAVARSITVNGIHTSGTVSGSQFFDHTISSTAITVNASNQVTSGTITVQHNLARYVATTSVASTLGFSAGCCYPTSGTITTTYSNGDPTETITFSSTCGAVTVNGQSFTLTQCF